MSHLAGAQRSQIAAALLLTSPFTPMLFQGEEWSASSPFLYFTDHQEPELGEAVRRGRREEFAQFGWDPSEVPDPQDRQTFERSKLNWSELDRPPHAEMLDLYRRLIQLRRESPELSDPRLDRISIETSEETRTIEIHRGSMRILVNLGSMTAEFVSGESPVVHLSSDPAAQVTESGITLAGDSFAIVGHSTDG